MIVGTVNRAKSTSQEVQKVFSGRISENTLVLCDGLKKTMKATGSGFYNLNTVNSLHSFIKRQYKFYRGVATKYLNRYKALSVLYINAQRKDSGRSCHRS